MARMLVADDDDRHRAMLRTILEDWGHEVAETRDGEAACAIFVAGEPDLVLLDVRMPGKNGLEVLKEIHPQNPAVPIVLMTAYSEIASAVEAMRNGAWDYLPKPMDFARLQACIANALERRKGEMRAEAATGQALPFVGGSAAMKEVELLIRKAAPAEATLLITGESGTGKELAARAAHALSRRAGGPFVAINCGALPEALLESELFGHEKGAFTGADKAHEGLLRQAGGGTIFLDEVGEMPAAMQVKLLRVLQQREVLPVGGKKPLPLNCRVMAATNRDLAGEVAAGNFREDLYYRLNVVNIKMPPLRRRPEDVEPLAWQFAERFARLNGRTFLGFTAEAMNLLKAWHWPGNVRELENMMERAIILMPGEYIGLRELPERVQAAGQGWRTQRTGTEAGRGGDADFLDSDVIAIPTLEEVEKKVILATLARLGNNKTEAAKALGITRKTLHARLKRYGAEE